MSDNTAKAPSGESRIKETEPDDMNKILEKFGVKVNAAVVEFSKEPIQEKNSNENTTASSDSTNSTSGSYTKIDTSGTFLFNVLHQGYMKVIAKVQTPEIEEARKNKKIGKEQDTNTNSSNSKEKPDRETDM